jgi:hypothetical protein
MKKEHGELQNDEFNYIKKSIIEDKQFRKALLLELLGWTIKAVGFGGAIAAAVIALLIMFFGHSSLNSLAESTMKDHLTSKGEEFERQFERLSKIPSYTTASKELIVNNPDSNFVPLPIFNDIRRRARMEECEWFVTPNEIKGIEVDIYIDPDTVENVEGLRITSINKIPTGVSYRHAPGLPTTDESPPFRAKIFIFASRKLP